LAAGRKANAWRANHFQQQDNRHGRKNHRPVIEPDSKKLRQTRRADHNGREFLRMMELHMSIKTRIAALALAALAVTGTIASTTQSAEAKGLGWGIGAGLIGAAVVGSAIAASNDGYYHDGYYYDGYRRCVWVRQYNSYGNYVGRVRTCNY
jgi:hypothetical protein